MFNVKRYYATRMSGLEEKKKAGNSNWAKVDCKQVDLIKMYTFICHLSS